MWQVTFRTHKKGAAGANIDCNFPLVRTTCRRLVVTVEQANLCTCQQRVQDKGVPRKHLLCLPHGKGRSAPTDPGRLACERPGSTYF